MVERRVLVGGTKIHAGAAVPDSNWLEIERLASTWIELATRDGGWATLFRDPDTGELWERTYPDSASHGGGAPMIEQLEALDVARLYGVDVGD
jgi:hypothetical protein